MHLYYTFPFLALGLMILAQAFPNLATLIGFVAAVTYVYAADKADKA